MAFVAVISSLSRLIGDHKLPQFSLSLSAVSFLAGRAKSASRVVARSKMHHSAAVSERLADLLPLCDLPRLKRSGT